jgi:hypothetical protein
MQGVLGRRLVGNDKTCRVKSRTIASWVILPSRTLSAANHVSLGSKRL